MAGILVMVVFGCGPEGGLGPSSFQSQYNAARTALESGRYARAIGGYTRLLEQAGPLAARVRLELAHSYLRDNQFAAASQQARRLATTLDGPDKAAALAVQATADHELGLAALAAGDRAKGASFLRQADAAMKTVVDNHPDLDPLGALAARRASIAVRLRGL
ncbi:hypothetical protein [uncultured Tateyamaria sp.]|uniref:hypothetical protein n=1 Tax=Tateyamaria sp. 1078 TaxID=3417464 RepID=UPI002638F909|nr:hypothetical protein [uncultured Tateyamaria sp.]